MAEARKKEAEAAEHDPENFPEGPASAATPVNSETPVNKSSDESVAGEPAAVETDAGSLPAASEPTAVVAEDPPAEETKTEAPAG